MSSFSSLYSFLRLMVILVGFDDWIVDVGIGIFFDLDEHVDEDDELVELVELDEDDEADSLPLDEDSHELDEDELDDDDIDEVERSFSCSFSLLKLSFLAGIDAFIDKSNGSVVVLVVVVEGESVRSFFIFL